MEDAVDYGYTDAALALLKGMEEEKLAVSPKLFMKIAKKGFGYVNSSRGKQILADAIFIPLQIIINLTNGYSTGACQSVGCMSLVIIVIPTTVAIGCMFP